jgi:hypothetical protein
LKSGARSRAYTGISSWRNFIHEFESQQVAIKAQRASHVRSIDHCTRFPAEGDQQDAAFVFQSEHLDAASNEQDSCSLIALPSRVGTDAFVRPVEAKTGGNTTNTYVEESSGFLGRWAELDHSSPFLRRKPLHSPRKLGWYVKLNYFCHGCVLQVFCSFPQVQPCQKSN